MPLRLYWLLVLRPDLDAGRPAVSWLVTALSCGDLGGPALELYRQELLERPSAALAAGDRLLDTAAPAARLADLADARLRAAGRLRHWPPDLDRLRERLSAEDEEAWLRLQFTAADSLVWWWWPHAFSDVSMLSVCEAEIRRHGHLGMRLGYLFDRYDLLTAAGAGWRKLMEAGRLPANVLRLFPSGWSEPFSAVRPDLVRVLERITAAPHDWLRHFDAMRRACPALMTLFADLLQDYEDHLSEPPTSPHPQEVLRRVTADFFDEAGLVPYKSLRPGLLDFCVAEAVGPEWLADVAPPRPVDWPSPKASLPETLRNDWPMRLVCWAVRLFWA